MDQQHIGLGLGQRLAVADGERERQRPGQRRRADDDGAGPGLLVAATIIGCDHHPTVPAAIDRTGGDLAHDRLDPTDVGLVCLSGLGEFHPFLIG